MPGLPGLETILTAQVFAFLLIFTRIGAMMVLLPGIGDGFVSPQIRLAFALAVAFLLTPLLAPGLPGLPSDPAVLALLVAGEAMVGIAIGAAARLLLSAMNVAGNVIAMSTGLGFAINVDPTQGQQGAILATFLVTLGIVMIFATGAHQLLFAAMVQSYTLFPPGAFPPPDDLLRLATLYVSGSFALGIQLSAPFLILSLVFYGGLGVVSRLMPQFQIFFIAVPASILAGFALLMLLLPLMIGIFLDRFQDAMGAIAR